MDLIQKLQIKNIDKLAIVNAPTEFSNLMTDFKTHFNVETEIKDTLSFILVFVKNRGEIIKWAKLAIGSLIDDGLLWFAYPKKSSKAYKTDISRDEGWESLSQVGYRPVRQIAIDKDWSALRFRKQKYVKSK